jgi:hypothetical protein
MHKVVSIENSLNNNNGKEDGALPFEESFLIFDKYHDK